MKYIKVVILPKKDKDEIVVKEENIVKPSADTELEVRVQGSLAGAGLFLNSVYDWVIAEDSVGTLVLLKLHKEDQG